MHLFYNWNLLFISNAKSMLKNIWILILDIWNILYTLCDVCTIV